MIPNTPASFQNGIPMKKKPWIVGFFRLTKEFLKEKGTELGLAVSAVSAIVGVVLGIPLYFSDAISLSTELFFFLPITIIIILIINELIVERLRILNDKVNKYR